MAEFKNTNLKMLALEQKKKGDLESAATTLQQAIAAAGQELADLHGILGGVRKVQGSFALAAAAYDAGFWIDSQYESLSSYNELNRLIMRIRLCPGAMSDPEQLRKEDTLAFVDLRHALSQLEQALKRQLKTARSDDYWAAGDLALTAALNGNKRTAFEAVEKFVSCATSSNAAAYEAYIRTLNELGQLDTPQKELLLEVKALLEKKRPGHKVDLS